MRSWRSTVRETSPDTVELRQAEGIRKSSRVPYVRTQEPGSASTAISGSKPANSGNSLIAAASSRVMAPLPVQPSTNTTSAGSWWAASQRSALGSMPRPRTMETA